MAIGDPLVRQRVETANLLERTKISARQRQKQIAELRRYIAFAPAEIENIKTAKALLEKDEALYLASKESIPNDERIAFGEELLDALENNNMQESDRMFDYYQGFKIVLPANMDPQSPYIAVESENGGRYTVDIDTDKPLGCSMRIDRLLSDLTTRVANMFERIAEVEKNTLAAASSVSSGNEYLQTVESLQRELDELDRKIYENNKKSA